MGLRGLGICVNSKFTQCWCSEFIVDVLNLWSQQEKSQRSRWPESHSTKVIRLGVLQTSCKEKWWNSVFSKGLEVAAHQAVEAIAYERLKHGHSKGDWRSVICCVFVRCHDRGDLNIVLDVSYGLWDLIWFRLCWPGIIQFEELQLRDEIMFNPCMHKSTSTLIKFNYHSCL